MTEKFVEITNQQMYEEFRKSCLEVEEKFDKISEKLESIEKHVIKTNGHVSLNKWIATTALSVALIAIGWIISLKMNGGI